MLARSRYENARTASAGVLEITDLDAVVIGSPPPTLPRRPRAPESPRLDFVPLVRTVLTGRVVGPIAALTLTQVYRYTRDQCDKRLAATYRFPIPGDAAVTGVTVRFGTTSIETTLKPRGTAETEFAAAKAEGRRAALVTRESADVFTLALTGLAPDEEITVETRYVEAAALDRDAWALRVPLTVAPRYTRADETGRGPGANPLRFARDPGHRFALDLLMEGVDGPTSVTSPTHAITAIDVDAASAVGVIASANGSSPTLPWTDAVTRPARALRVQLAGGELLPDRDCVLRWTMAPENAPAVRAFVHDDPADGEAFYALVALGVPRADHQRTAVSRDVVVLVDRSGSMTGSKWDAAVWAVARFLADLTPADRFSVCLFDDEQIWFRDTPLPATAEAVAEATQFVQAHAPNGGTELGIALEQALRKPRRAGAVARHVLVITDAQVTDEGRLVELVTGEAGRPDRRRVSMLCIDAAPNSSLVEELTEVGGGTARYLTSAPDAADIATALDEVLSDWAAPVETGATLSIDRADVLAAGRAMQSTRAAGGVGGATRVELGDLVPGRAAWVVLRVPREVAGGADRARGDAVMLRLESDRGALAEFAVRAGADAVPAIRALYGSVRVRALERLAQTASWARDPSTVLTGLRRLGVDPSRPGASGSVAPHAPLYAENRQAEIRELVTRLLIEESLASGIPSTETAFVAVRTEAGERVEAEVLVGNALPAGWEMPLAATGHAFIAAAHHSSASFPNVVTRSARSATPRTFMKAHDIDFETPITAMASDVTSEVRRWTDTAPASPNVGQHARAHTLFNGVPTFARGEAVLLDLAHPDGRVPSRAAAITVRLLGDFAAGAPLGRESLNGVVLLIYSGDLAVPAARIVLRDVLRAGGRRPLALHFADDGPVRVVLHDPLGHWPDGVGVEITML